MLRVRIRVLLVITAHLPLLHAEPSRSEETSSVSGRDEVKSDSCGKDCEDRTRVRKRSTRGTKCELYYFVPTAKHTDEAFFFWDNTKAEQLRAYDKIVPFLQENPYEDKPTFFPAHLPLVIKRGDGRNALVLKDVYVRAKGTCGEHPGANDPSYFDTSPGWFKDREEKLQVELRILEDYVQRIPRSHWGYRVPKAGEDDVCLDETGLVVKDFPGIRTCFSMWIFDDRDGKPKHFAGRQIYNRINQKLTMNISGIGFDPAPGDSLVKPISTEEFSLPALFLKEMCFVTNASRENRCTYWTTNQFYVSLCCCYTNRKECAYRNYKFPSQKKPDDPVIRACATGHYYVMKDYGGMHEPKNASGIASSVRQFVQERTSSEVCKWTYTWNTSNETKLEDVLRVYLGTEKPGSVRDEPVLFAKWMRSCASNVHKTCCQRTTTLCPLDPKQDTNEIVAECFCSDDDLCNKPRSNMDKNLVKKFKEARPCETHTVYEHLLRQSTHYKKPNTDPTDGFMCPIFYNFAHPGRPNTFLQLVSMNNFVLLIASDYTLFQEERCHLVEAEIKEVVNCTDTLFGKHNETTYEILLILLCAVQGNPLGAYRTSYPDAELKKTIARNLTAAKAEFPTCKTGSLSLDFESLSELVVDNSKLERQYDNVTDGTNDNVTTAHCFVEVSFVYQQQYRFTFGAVSIDNKSLHLSCHESERLKKSVRMNSTADGEQQQFTSCCRRHWSKPMDMCRTVLLEQLKTLLAESVIAKKPEQIMIELKTDPLTKCFEVEKPKEGQAGNKVNRPCSRNEGCYTGVHARDVPATRQPKEYRGCVSEYAPDAKKRADSTSGDVGARFYRICRLSRNQGQCFAVLGTEDVELPEDMKGPQMVCCCRGRVETAQKCGTSHKFGMKIGDFDL